jgi:hypothetical protein
VRVLGLPLANSILQSLFVEIPRYSQNYGTPSPGWNSQDFQCRFGNPLQIPFAMSEFVEIPLQSLCFKVCWLKSPNLWDSRNCPGIMGFPRFPVKIRKSLANSILQSLFVESPRDRSPITPPPRIGIPRFPVQIRKSL